MYSFQDTPIELDCREIHVSPWVRMAERVLKMPGKIKPEIYHSLRQADYVSMLAITPEEKILLVRQFRPAQEGFTLELPSGLRDEHEYPETTGIRELYEETGHKPLSSPIFLGNMAPDTGRLENRLWGFMVNVESLPDFDWRPEAGVETLVVTVAELRQLILDGQFNHALHIAVIGLAIMQGYLRGV